MGIIRKEDVHSSFDDYIKEVVDYDSTITSLNAKANKDGTIQIGLNAEKVGGVGIDSIFTNVGFTVENVDFNTLIIPGIYKVKGNACINVPTSISLSVIQHSCVLVYTLGTTVVQKLITTNNSAYGDYSNIEFMRVSLGGVTWTAWRELSFGKSITFPTLLNGWSQAIGDMRNTVVKNGNSVTLNFSFKGGTATDGTTLFNLPADYRPSTNILVSGVENWSNIASGKTYVLNIKSDGSVNLRTSNFLSSETYICGVSFAVGV